MKWIKTSEQLPPKDCYVLGYVKQHKNEDERVFALVKLVEEVELTLLESTNFLGKIANHYFGEINNYASPLSPEGVIT